MTLLAIPDSTFLNPLYQLFLSPIGTFYLLGVLLTNIHCCLNGNQISSKFRLPSPSLEEYLKELE